MKIYLAPLLIAVLVSCNDGSGPTTVSASPVRVFTAALPDGEVGSHYHSTLAAVGGTGDHAWSVVGGSLPSGLSLTADGRITGLPARSETTSFIVRATSGGASDTAQLTISVLPPEVVIATENLVTGVAGAEYHQSLAAVGGDGTYVWSLTSGSMPAGLDLSSAGILSGIPTTPGASAITIQVTSGGRTGTGVFPITISEPVLAITSTSLPEAVVGTAYRQQLSASGGDGNYSWSVVDGLLPAGLTLSANGVISGQPTTPGTSSFSVRVTSSASSATRELSLAIRAPALSITTTALPDGTVGEPYVQTLTAAGGAGSYVWAVTEGSLPPGLALSPGGTIAGEPTAAGSSSFTVRLTSGDQAAIAVLAIAIGATSVPVQIMTGSLAAGRVGDPYSETLIAAGGAGSYSWSLVAGDLPPGLDLSAGGTITGIPTGADTSAFTVQAESGGTSDTRALSIAVSAGTGDTQAPSVPTGLTGTAVSSSRVDLSWAGSTDNVGVSGYHVYRDGERVGSSSGRTYTDTGLSTSATYGYTVAAYDAADNVSAQSATVSVTTKSATTGSTVAIPQTSEWVDRGRVLTPGGTGTWDDRWPAGTPGTIVKRSGQYFLYYIGADGVRADGGPAHRKIGVATSTDARTWTKYSGNPRIAFSPNNDNEEGAWRLAAMLDADGTVLLYATMLTGKAGTVNGDIRLYTSTDGVTFTDRGVVVRHSNTSFPGGDELGMLGAALKDGRYEVFYTAKGTPTWDLARTAASTPTGFTTGNLLLSPSTDIRYGSNPIPISDTEWINFAGLHKSGYDIQVRRTTDLSVAGTLATTWTNLGTGNFAVYLDRERNEWLMLAGMGSDPDNLEGLKLLTAPVRMQ